MKSLCKTTLVVSPYLLFSGLKLLNLVKMFQN